MELAGGSEDTRSLGSGSGTGDESSGGCDVGLPGAVIDADVAAEDQDDDDAYDTAVMPLPTAPAAVAENSRLRELINNDERHRSDSVDTDDSDFDADPDEQEAAGRPGEAALEEDISRVLGQSFEPRRRLDQVYQQGDLSVYSLTWNLHGSLPRSRAMTQVLASGYDIYAIGTEECERAIASAVVFPSKDKFEAMLRTLLAPAYVPVRMHTLAAIHLAVFIRADMYGQVSNVSSAAVATGIGNVVGNKGGIRISLRVGTQALSFINCHLASGQRAVAKRNADVQRIQSELLRASSDDVTVWMGDLNYRINGTRGMVDALLASDLREVMLANDQLNVQRRSGAVFAGWNEAALTFLPTYKYDKDGVTFDSSEKQRVPGWTDRILWQCQRQQQVRLDAYDSYQNVNGSDHKPVYAALSVQVPELQALAAADNNEAGVSRFCSIL